MIDDEKLVDALDDIRHTVTPALLEKLEGNAAACRYYAERGSKADAALVAQLEALLVLARELAK